MRACRHFQNSKTSINQNKLTIGTKTLYKNIKLITYGEQKTHLKIQFSVEIKTIRNITQHPRFLIFPFMHLCLMSLPTPGPQLENG